MAVADELTTILGVDIAKDAMAKLESFKKGINGIKKGLLAVSVAVTGAAATLGLMVKSAADEAMELSKLSDKTGLSTDALQEWAYAAKAVGGDAKSIQNDLLGLQQRFVGTGKSAEKSLMSLADSFSKMSGSQAQIQGKAWGLSDDTIQLLRKGRDGIEALKKEAHQLGGIIPAEGIKRAAEFKKKLGELQFAFHGITSQVAIAMIPALSRVLEIFKGWMLKNQEWISLGLEAIMTGLVNGFERFWKMLQKVGEWFKPLTEKLKGLTGGMTISERITHLVTGALAGLLIVFTPLIAKFILIGAAVAFAAEIFEDLFSSITTGKGVFADMFAAFEQRWPNLANAVKKIGGFIKEYFIDAFNSAKDGLKEIAGVFAELFGQLFDNLDQISGPVGEFFSTFSEKFPALTDMLQTFANFIKDTVLVIFYGWKELIKLIIDQIKLIPDALNKVAEWGEEVASFLGFGKGKDKKGKTPAIDREATMQAKVGEATMQAKVGLPKEMRVQALQARGGPVYNDNKTQNVTVVSPDPQQAGQAVVTALGGQPPEAMAVPQGRR